MSRRILLTLLICCFYFVGYAVNTITIGTLGTPFCAGSAISIPGTTSAAFTGTFTAYLSDATGVFSPAATGVLLGSTTVTAATSFTIAGTIPGGTAFGTAYKLQIVWSGGATKVSSAFTINNGGPALNAPTFTGTTFCQANTFTLTYSFPTGNCNFSTGNIFTAQLSDQFGLFGAPVTLGTVSRTTGGTILGCLIPATQTPGNAYRIRVVGSNPSIISPDNGTNITINALAISVPSFPLLSYCTGQNFVVSFTSVSGCAFPNTPSNNVFTAQLSDATGSFGAPINIGTQTASGSSTITANIPGGTPSGSGYRIRIVSSNPTTGPIVSPDNGANINVTTAPGNPLGTANIDGQGFGTTAWNVFVYNSSNGSSNYSGFFTDNGAGATGLNFSTTNYTKGPWTRAVPNGLPYTGCATDNRTWSIRCKRTNFTCGYYQIDLPAAVNNATLFINGVSVYFGGPKTNAWSGFLNASSTVEILSQCSISITGVLTANFSIATPIIVAPSIICPGGTATLNASSPIPLTYAWSPTTSPTTGATVTASPATTTTYTVTGTDASATPTGCTATKSVNVTVASSFTASVTNVSSPICSGVTTSTLTAAGAGTYTWSPAAGLSATTGNVVIANPATTTNYTVTASIGSCATDQMVSTNVVVNNIPTSPTPAFGNNVWNAFVYNDATLSTLYGYYTENNLSFNTTDRWAAASGPWTANNTTGSGYLGCPGLASPWSISFQRSNFDCQYYQIDIPAHTQTGSIIINGTTVYTMVNDGLAHTNVWSGFLGITTNVEVRLVNSNGAGNLQLTLTPVVPLTVPSSAQSCFSASSVSLLSTTIASGVNYLWTSADGNGINSPTSANTFAIMGGVNDIFTLTITDPVSNCNFSADMNVTVTDPLNYTAPVVTVTPTSGTSFCPSTAFTLTAAGASDYTWTQSPAGSSLNTTTGFQVIATPAVTTTYTVSGNDGCTASTANVTITVNPLPAITTFPTGAWNAYGFNSTTVGTNYVGYYTENGSGPSGFDFNTATRWTSGVSPSTANSTNGQPWQGCTMLADNMSLSFKRTGFPCGLYQLNVLNHDDFFVLFINGVQVAQHTNGIGDSHSAIWTGMLCSTSTVEWQLVQLLSGSGLSIQFVPLSVPATSTLWTGSISNDWSNAGNWCSTVPNSITDALIPGLAQNFPTITAASQVNSINISPAVVAGTYTNAIPAASLTNAASNSFDVYGSWSNGGTFTANTGTVNFTGGNFGNTITNAFPTTFYNATINNSNGITNSVGLINVSNLLTFISGVLTDVPTIAAINILNGATTTGASDNSYVAGLITKTGNVAFTFPVGGGGVFRPIAISAPALTTDNFTAQYFNTNPNPGFPNASRAATLDHISGAEYWYLNRTGGSSNVSVTLTWNNPTSGGVGNPATLRVARWDVATAKWVDQGNSATTGNTTAGTVTSGTAISTFSTPNSPFTLASTNLQNPLPVELTEFACTLLSPGSVSIVWVTESEINNDHFEIERSTDGKTFSKILSVAGHGTTSIAHNYAAKDLSVPAGMVYYRLAQVDDDGVVTYSEIESVENPYATSISMYPNPAGNSFTIDLNGRTLSSFSIIDLTDREMSVPFTVTTDALSVSSSALAPGLYVVQLVLDGNAYRLKLIRK